MRTALLSWMHTHSFVVAVALLCATVAAQGKVAEQNRFKIVGLDGKPASSSVFGVRFQGARDHFAQVLETDDRGHLVVEAPELFQGKNKGSLILRRVELQDDVPKEYLGVKVIPFAELGRPGVLAVQLAKPELLIGGTVVDRQGKPVKGLVVEVGEDADGYPRHHEVEFNKSIYECRVVSDAKGRFAVKVESRNRNSMRLRVCTEGYETFGRTHFGFWRADAKVVVGRVSTVEAKILGVPKRADARTPCRLIPKFEIPGQKYIAPDFLRSRGGVLEIDSVFAGTYDFVLLDPVDQKTEVFRVDNLVVEAGKPCRDPRIAAIDLSKTFRWVKITVRDSAGEQIRMLSSNALRGARMNRTAGRGDDFDIMVRKDGVDMKFSAPGFREQVVKNITKDTEVVMRRGWIGEVRVTNLPALASSDLVVRLASEDKRRMRYTGDEARLHKAKDAYQQVLAGAGVQTFRLVIAPRQAEQRGRGMGFGSGRRSTAGTIAIGIRRFPVAEDADPSKSIPFHIRLTPTELAVVESFDALMKEREAK